MERTPLALRWQAGFLQALRALGLLKVAAVQAHLASLGAEVDPSTVARWVEGNRTAPLGLFPALLEHCGAREVLTYIAAEYDLDVVPRNLPRRRPQDLAGEVLDLVAVVGELAGKARTAIADGRLDEEEREDIARALDQAERELREIRATLPARSSR